MKKTIIPAKAKGLQGVITVPGDKSISHRAFILGALARGVTEIEGALLSADCLRTQRCLRSLGVSITKVKNGAENLLQVQGQNLDGLREPSQILYMGNSGTTMRLFSGLLAGQPFTSFLSGDASLIRRPMQRVVLPLRQMGAQIMGRADGHLAPLAIKGGGLRSITYVMPVASAQVKSALLLAGLYTPGWTEIKEPLPSRNHTEVMLESFGAEIVRQNRVVGIRGLTELRGQKVYVPGDLSAAAFFLVAGLIVPNSQITIKAVGLNPTRDGIIEVLQAMGANLRVFDLVTRGGERWGSIEVKSSTLRGISLGGEIIPRLIDELPILAVAASFAQGVTEIRDAAELKVKESNRLRAIAEGLTRLGGQVEELSDGLRLQGGRPLQGAFCRGYHDHRIVMALAIAALGARGETVLSDAETVGISFPNFWVLLDELR